MTRFGLQMHLELLGMILLVARAVDELNERLDRLAERFAGLEGTVARIARELVDRCRALTTEINRLEREISELVARLSPTLLAICQLPVAAAAESVSCCGCGALTAAKILAETAGIERFKSSDAYARHNGSAPPVWSSNRGTPRSTASRLPRPASTQAHRPCSPAGAPTATAASKRSAYSNAASQTSSTARSSPTCTPPRPPSVDRGARDSPILTD